MSCQETMLELKFEGRICMTLRDNWVGKS
jgi:hypothetical protein